MQDEVHLRHLTVDEAMVKLDEFIHRAYVSGLMQVKFVRFKGAGIIRQATQRELSRHPPIRSFRPGQRGEGGAEVTVIQLSYR